MEGCIEVQPAAKDKKLATITLYQKLDFHFFAPND